MKSTPLPHCLVTILQLRLPSYQRPDRNNQQTRQSIFPELKNELNIELSHVKIYIYIIGC